jgi:hypothetical protein
VALTSEDPLNPTVVLSGEVEGLKPPAVADKPMEPRLFVMNRAAEATEVVSCLENLLLLYHAQSGIFYVWAFVCARDKCALFTVALGAWSVDSAL